MSEAREAILARLRESLARSSEDEEVARKAVEERLAAPQPNIIPARGQLDRKGKVALFAQMAERVSADVRHLAEIIDVPAAVAAYLREHNFPQKLVMAPHPILEAARWDSQPLLRVRQGAPEPTDEVGLTVAAAGVAETGTLTLVSDEEAPTLLAFLPAISIILVFADDIDGAYEQNWQRLRQTMGQPPRSVNFITGPSRTADIAQKLELGAHGPKRLLILLVDRLPPSA